MRALLLFLGVSLVAGPATALDGDAPPDLKVEKRLPTASTGTMHFAEIVVLRVGRARPLVLEGELAPIPGPYVRLGDSRFLLLGWSSGGSGMQTLHALSLAVVGGAVTLVAELTLQTDRLSSGLLLRTGEGDQTRLGVPEPPAGFVHDADGWALRTGPGDDERFDLDGIRGLSFEEVAGQPGDILYSPPFGVGPLPKRVAWVSVSPAGRFAPPTPAATPDSLLRRLYAAHQPWSEHDIWLDEMAGKPSLGRFLDEPLVRLAHLDDACKESTGGVGLLDFDPFLDAQDYDDLGLSEQEIRWTTANKSATCKVSFQLFRDWPDTRQRLDYSLSLSPKGWRVHDIAYESGASLLGTLSRPCE